jgi:hypothetical protein
MGWILLVEPILAHSLRTMLKPVSFLLSVTHFISVCSAASSGELAAYQAVVRRVGLVKSAMLASIRTR